MAERRRNYAAEYKRRLQVAAQRSRVLGISFDRRTARGHAGRGQLSARDEKILLAATTGSPDAFRAALGSPEKQAAAMRTIMSWGGPGGRFHQTPRRDLPVALRQWLEGMFGASWGQIFYSGNVSPLRKRRSA